MGAMPHEMREYSTKSLVQTRNDSKNIRTTRESPHQKLRFSQADLPFLRAMNDYFWSKPELTGDKNLRFIDH